MSRTLVGFVLGGVVGVLLGHYGWRDASARPAAPILASARAERRLVCTDVAQIAPSSTDCGEVDTRLKWCEGRLAAASREKPTGRREWPATNPDEAPDRWTENLASLVQRCQLPADIVVTDCDEYPCVAGVRPQDPTLSRKAFVEMVETCPATTELFPGLNADAVNVPVHCPDGSTEPGLVMFIMGDTDAKNPAVAALFPGQEVQLADVIVYAGRRTEAAVQMWDCE